MTTSSKAKKILLAFLFGCLSNFAYQHVRERASKQQPNEEQIDVQCTSCESQICAFCPPVKIFLPVDNEISEPYKPKGMYEISRWLYFEEDQVYDIINEEPKHAIKGYWKEEIRSAIALGIKYIKINDILDKSWMFDKLKSGYMRTDGRRGTDLMLDLLFKSAGGETERYKLFRVHLVHPFDPVQKARLQTVKKQSKRKTTIITNLKNSEYVDDLMKNFNTTFQNENVQVLVVLNAGSSNGKKAKDSVLRAKSRFPSLNIKVVESKRTNIFNVDQISYLNAIAKTAKSAPNDIIATIQEDMHVKPGFLHHCKALCEEQVYFPIAFAKFDPDVIEKGMPPGKPKHINKMDHNRYTGSWAHNTRKSVCALGQNWLQVIGRASFSYNKQLKVEDWLYGRFAQTGLRIVTAVEPNLYVVNLKKLCTQFKPFPDELKQCVKAKSAHHGSKIALGILYITESMSKKVKT